MTYDQSIGTREPGSGKFVLFTDRRVRSEGRLHGNDPQLYWKKGVSAGQIWGFDPRVSRKHLAGDDG